MTHLQAWLPSVAVASLVFGLNFPHPNLAGGRAPLPSILYDLVEKNSQWSHSRLASEEFKPATIEPVDAMTRPHGESYEKLDPL
jgi:hypothetical protein